MTYLRKDCRENRITLARTSDRREREREWSIRGEQGWKKDTKTFSYVSFPFYPLFSLVSAVRYPCSFLSDMMAFTVSYVCHSPATPGQCPSFRYLPSNCSSSLCSPIPWNPETNILGWRMDLLQGTARKQDGRVDKGRSFLLGWKKESYLPLVIAWGTVLEREGGGGCWRWPSFVLLNDRGW